MEAHRRTPHTPAPFSLRQLPPRGGEAGNRWRLASVLATHVNTPEIRLMDLAGNPYSLGAKVQISVGDTIPAL